MCVFSTSLALQSVFKVLKNRKSPSTEDQSEITFGRGLGIILVKFISIQKLLASNIILSVLTVILQVVFIYDSYVVLWLCSGGVGLFISSVYGSAFTFAEQYIDVSGGAGGFFVAASSMGNLTGPILITALFDLYGMKTYLYILLVAGCVMFVMYIFATMIAVRHGKREIFPTPSMSGETDRLLSDNEVKYNT